MWDLIVSVPDNCFSFYFGQKDKYIDDRNSGNSG